MRYSAVSYVPKKIISRPFLLLTYYIQNGNGATSFGVASDANPPLSNDAQHNVLAAMVRWVEEGIAPDSFTAAHYTDGNASSGVDFTRPVCKVRYCLLL